MSSFQDQTPLITANGMRRSRFSQRQGEWFLMTSEGVELGPFESHAEAAMCLNDYLEFVEGADAIDVQQFYKIYAVA
ncbi:MAG: hypothetical protein HRU21_02470 [Pseudomonadales bacterium]|nr:hypothetical protein [Pseudomonadales bacterium]